MRKLLTIALWVACPMLSLASTVSGSFEDRSQSIRGQGLDVVPAVAQRPTVAFHASQGPNYSLSPANRTTTGLKTQAATGVPAEPAADSFAAKAVAEGNPNATPPEADPTVSTPIPEPQSYLLMMAGLAALAFMAARRGRG